MFYALTYKTYSPRNVTYEPYFRFNDTQKFQFSIFNYKGKDVITLSSVKVNKLLSRTRYDDVLVYGTNDNNENSMLVLEKVDDV